MKCLIKKCFSLPIYSRGLCEHHYQILGRKVREKKYTWKDFSELGMAIEKVRKEHDLSYYKTFQEMLAEKAKDK